MYADAALSFLILLHLQWIYFLYEENLINTSHNLLKKSFAFLSVYEVLKCTYVKSSLGNKHKVNESNEVLFLFKIICVHVVLQMLSNLMTTPFPRNLK